MRNKCDDIQNGLYKYENCESPVTMAATYYTWVGHRPATERVVDPDPRSVATPVPLWAWPTVGGAVIVRVPEGAQ